MEMYDSNIPKNNNMQQPLMYQPLYQLNGLPPIPGLTYGPNLQIPSGNKIININLPGPTGNHVEMKNIYEHVLPGKNNKYSSSTIGERIKVYDYTRQILVKKMDGEEISLDSDSQRSLLSYLKIMEVNPNYYSPITNNPYSGLPYGLLIYRSCFPIRVDENNSNITCASNSLGLNIRLYSLSIAEYCSFANQNDYYTSYDVWRELAYYEYVREQIIKKKVSPNFPILYAYFTSKNNKIDIFSLKQRTLTQKDCLTAEFLRFKANHEAINNPKFKNKLLSISVTMSTNQSPRTIVDMKNYITKLPDEIDPTLQVYSGNTLVMITEAPHSNLYQWASKNYRKNGIVNKMTTTGFYDDFVWISVLFQIISALYVLQINDIYIRDMTIEDNVYIKDLQNFGKASGYWKYIINGISYYIPNYGHLVFIDTNYKDIIKESQTAVNRKRLYKIYGSKIIGNKYNSDQIKKRVFENYRKIINTNNFTREHTQNDVTRPPEQIMTLISQMMTDGETDLSIVLQKYFLTLMNNRIGTLLKRDTEIPNIRESTYKLSVGDMAVEYIDDSTYKWCLILSIDNEMANIATRDNNSKQVSTRQIRLDSLKQYSQSETIEQNFVTNGPNLSEGELIETYIINSH